MSGALRQYTVRARRNGNRSLKPVGPTLDAKPEPLAQFDIVFERISLSETIYVLDALRGRMACDKINADGSEKDTESFAQGERFVQENQSEHGAANDKHAIDRDDDAGRPFG